MNMLKITAKRAVSLATALVLGLSTLSAQANLTRLHARFSNPQLNAQAKSYTMDIEMRAEGAAEKLFGINLRFFYDASELEFVSLSELHPSYLIQGEAPHAFRGNDASGSAMFNFVAAAAYINTAIQLAKETDPLEISDKQWTKIGKLNFKIPDLALSADHLCPSLLWDQRASAAGQQGYLPGSGGIVVTLLETDPKTRETTKPAQVVATAFNWESIGTDVMPFGHPVDQDCFPLTTTSLYEVSDPKGYVLFQNYPNPFANNTVIEFVLPKAEEARLVFCDVAGRILHTIQGDYKAGRNAVKIERSTWPAQGTMLFYRLETADFVSKALKMNVVDK